MVFFFEGRTGKAPKARGWGAGGGVGGGGGMFRVQGVSSRSQIPSS